MDQGSPRVNARSQSVNHLGNELLPDAEMRKRRILCLDGGGIRGISTLLILQKIMENIRDLCRLPKTPKPCEYFDLIGGTSTGGIIAIMLGPLCMTVAQCLEAYKDIGERAFMPADKGLSRLRPHFPGRPQGAFSAAGLAGAIKNIVEVYKGDREALFADQTCCKTVVLAVIKADVGAIPTKFKTYDIGDDFRECKIWEIARATSAATTFFESIRCGRQEIEFIDAGFGHNNPSEVLLDEARDLFPNEEFDCILSIGTGMKGTITIRDARISILKALKTMASNSEAVNRRLAKRFPEGVYFRFDVTHGLDDIAISDWKKSSKISAHTTSYLADVRVERDILRCARTLAQGVISSLKGKEVVELKNSSQAIILDKHFEAYCRRLQQNLPSQVLLQDPVVLYDALDGVFVFHLDWVTSVEIFTVILEGRTYNTLEDRYKERGSEKIRKGEFLLQDPTSNRNFNLQQQPWNFVMRPGSKRYMSIKFKDTVAVESTCRHCGAGNESTEGQPTICKGCRIVYERITEIEEWPFAAKQRSNGKTARRNAGRGRQNATAGRYPDRDDDLRLAFRRLTLTLKGIRYKSTFPFETDMQRYN